MREGFGTLAEFARAGNAGQGGGGATRVYSEKRDVLSIAQDCRRAIRDD